MSIYIKAGSSLTYLRSVLDKQTASYQKSMEQISSGSKYTSVSDNPVYVCESAKLGAKINANEQAASNIEFSKSMLKMAVDAQENVSSNMARINDLCTQAANGTYSAEDKDLILKEIRARLNYIDSAADSTNFNGINLLNGDSSDIFLQIGPSSDATMDVGDALIDIHTDALHIKLDNSVTGDTWTTDDIQNYMSNLDIATKTLLGTGAKLGGYLNRLDFVSGTLTTMNNNLAENKSIISDSDVAESSADMVRYQILQEASVSILTQANQVPSWALQLLNK